MPPKEKPQAATVAATNKKELQSVEAIVEILQDLDPEDVDNTPMTRVVGTVVMYLGLEGDVREFCNLDDCE